MMGISSLSSFHALFGVPSVPLAPRWRSDSQIWADFNYYLLQPICSLNLSAHLFSDNNTLNKNILYRTCSSHHVFGLPLLFQPSYLYLIDCTKTLLQFRNLQLHSPPTKILAVFPFFPPSRYLYFLTYSIFYLPILCV